MSDTIAHARPSAAEIGGREYGTIEELANKYPTLRTNYQLIRNAVVRREIASVKIGRVYRVDVASFEDWIARKFIAAA